ncbi:1-phosphatidylinositol-3-phosphate 5-kinase [Salvia divinorum]|uniref:1-phosphatidylinositol-3-phosphate 5-kinase n=1 Tax=Salvia divinorum TaxID=28513 RepID=A0ABD1FHA4_SALDI
MDHLKMAVAKINAHHPNILSLAADCSGAQIIPSTDSLSTTTLGYCCPRPLGCTVLLKGANWDELKKVKHVVHCGVFAAYHLALKTSILADEDASLPVPELPLKSPIKVAR